MTATTTEAKFTSLFDQASQAFGEAMKAGVKVQEDIAKCWSEALESGGALTQWQTRSRAMFDEAIPATQRNVETWLKVVEQNYNRSMDLLKKAFES